MVTARLSSAQTAELMLIMLAIADARTLLDRLTPITEVILIQADIDGAGNALSDFITRYGDEEGLAMLQQYLDDHLPKNPRDDGEEP